MAASILTIKVGPTTNSAQAGPNAGIAVRALKGAGARGLRGDTGMAKLRAWVNASRLKLVTFGNRTYLANDKALDLAVSSWCETNTGEVTQFLRESGGTTPDMTFIHARGPTEFQAMQESDKEVDVKATMQMSESAGKIVVVYVPLTGAAAPEPAPVMPDWRPRPGPRAQALTAALESEIRLAQARERGNQQSIEEVLAAVQITPKGFGTWA